MNLEISLWLQEAIEEFLIERVRKKNEVNYPKERFYFSVGVEDASSRDIIIRWEALGKKDYELKKSDIEIFTIKDAINKFLSSDEND